MTTTIIRPLLGFSKMKDADFLSALVAVLGGMKGHPAYRNPPISMAAFEAGIVSFSAAVVEALDGGKIAIAEKDKQRTVMTRMLVQLGYYVEFACNNDLATLISSGFRVWPSHALAPAEPLAAAGIRKVAQGETGELFVSIKAIPRAFLYELRYAASSPDGDPGPWKTLSHTHTRRLVVGGLTPGTIYIFEVRARGRLGYTDWSEPVSRMCT